MEKGLIQVYSGEGHGKSAAALGRAIQMASMGRDVVIINFLKSYQNEAFLKRMEPEIKIFRFEKSEEEFAQLSDKRKQEEIYNIKNGLNFAKKVLVTEECDVLILDEILGLTEKGIVTIDELRGLIDAVGEDTELLLTGNCRCEELWPYVDEVTELTTPFKKYD